MTMSIMTVSMFIYKLLSVLKCIVVSPCISVTCQNEGSCRVNNGIASCFCKGDFSGSNCEGKI